MSRVISADIQAQLESNQLFPFFLFEYVDNDGNYMQYTSLDVSQTFTYSGGPSGTYSPLGFEFEEITYSIGNVVDNASVRIDNLDQVQTALFVGDVLQGNTAALYVGVLSPSGTDLGTLKIFEGELDSWQLDETELVITVASLFSKWNARSSEKHSSSCRWKVFGGNECQYAGDQTWCDRSYTRCVFLANTQHFGGFRFLPAIENEVVWWGPTQEQYQKENN